MSKNIEELQKTLDISSQELKLMIYKDDVQMWANVFQDVRTKLIPQALKETQDNEELSHYLNRLGDILKLMMIQIFGEATDENMPKISRKSAEIVKFHADKLRKLTDECVS